MRFSFPRALQWFAITLVLAALVGINYDFDSEAGMRMNAPLDDPLSQSLRGYWKLDEGTGTSTTADASGNANTLSMTGPPTWTTGTIGPSAMDFSGSGQYLSVASPASGVLDFAAGASFSITGWFNRDTFTADHTIVAKRNGQTATDDGYIVYIDDSTDTLVFEASDTADTDEYQRVSTSAFTATGWHQFAVTWNDAADAALTTPVNIFIDGALSNGTATGTFANMGSLVESVAFRIGAESDAGVPFDGKLDDIRVYGSALSADEVTKLYQTTAPTQPVDTGLVGHWTFDGPDIQGTTAIDKSSFGNNGTITGTTKTIGKLGQGLSFNGTSDYVDIVDTNSLDWVYDGHYTYSFWLKPSNFDEWNVLFTVHQNATNYGLIIYAHTTTDTNWGPVTAGISFGVDYYNSSNGGRYVHSSNNVLAVGKWSHIACVYNGTQSNDVDKFSIYVDGVYVTDRTDLGSGGSSIVSSEFTSDTILLGKTWYAGEFANGLIDDVRVYNRALSAPEITNLYNIGR